MSVFRTRFDVGALRTLAGDKVFARGEAYHRDGHVEILARPSSPAHARAYTSRQQGVDDLANMILALAEPAQRRQPLEFGAAATSIDA